MKTCKLLLNLVCVAVVVSAVPQLPAQEFLMLTSFGAPGQTPLGALVRGADGTLYGTTSGGGAYGYGTVFRVNSDGTGATNLCSFGTTNGNNPYAGLVLAGDMLYGTTEYGGINGYGTVFAIQTDGSGFTNLHSFNYADGYYAQGALVLSNGVLYGTTEYGGTNGNGNVFSLDTNGSGFTSLRSFGISAYNGVNRSTNSDGFYPAAGLVLSGGVLYGVAEQGGTNGYGTVFAINTDGSGFTNLHSFTGDISDGNYPIGSLGLSGDLLYGTTEEGGTNSAGMVFSIQTDGSGFTSVHSFSYGGGSGYYPFAGLVVSGNVLYGTTIYGGLDGGGTLFQMNANGSGFTNVMNFNYQNTGYYPYGVTLSGSTLYGVVSQGGSAGHGTVYKVNTDGSGFAVLDDFLVVGGANPYGGVTVGSGNTLYGTLSSGGSANNGVVFQINRDGSGFAPLYDFIGGGTDGTSPYAGLVLSGNTLYGTTYSGGTHGNGEVFSVNVNGSGLSNVYSFQSSTGYNPSAALILSGNTLYGTTQNGGPAGYGTVFSVNTDGSGFAILHGFSSSSDGGDPKAALVLSGSMLYGTTSEGGSSGYGTVFGINTNGTGFTNLHSFGYSDGAYPYSDLVAFANVLYGTTESGGTNGAGDVFALTMDGGEFTNLYSFGYSDGANPYAGLVMSGNTLYGTTSSGGSLGYGTVFGININGAGFTNFYNFTGDNDGGNPYASLVFSSGVLYGTTSTEGSAGAGVVFKVNTDGTGFATLHAFEGGLDGANPYSGLVLSGGTLYGTASDGGVADQGTVFAVNAANGGFTTVHGFNSSSDGVSPYGTMVLSGTMLYGTTYRGGNQNVGTIFAIATNGSGLVTLHEFYGNGDGSYPYDGLLLSGGALYGTANSGGSFGYGTVFKINTDGSGFSVLKSFPAIENNPFTGRQNNADGANPQGGLVISGSTLYGTASSGGGFDNGTVFKVNTDGSAYGVLHIFGNSDGRYPYGGLALSGSTLYGTTYQGGNSGGGTVFKVNTDGSGYTLLHQFSYSDGASPYDTLVLSDDTLYGTTYSGGAQNDGTVFQMNLDGTHFYTLYSFSGDDGNAPYASLTLSGNTLYGVTLTGGPLGGGGVFSINVTPPTLQIVRSSPGVIVSWPSPSVGYVLEQNGTLFAPNWVDYGGALTTNGTTISATITPATGNQFFRLEQQ